MTRLTGTDALGLMEAYNAVYTPQELTEEQIQEDFENWVNELVEEGYDLSEYSWEEMYEDWKQNIMEMPFPNVRNTTPGDYGTGQLKLIRTPGGKEGYVNPHSQGKFLPPGTVNKIMGGDLMVKAKQKSKPTTQVAHFDLYDYIKGHLIDEGYADTEQDALIIMSNMSEDWKESIVEGIMNAVGNAVRRINPYDAAQAAGTVAGNVQRAVGNVQRTASSLANTFNTARQGAATGRGVESNRAGGIQVRGNARLYPPSSR